MATVFQVREKNGRVLVKKVERIVPTFNMAIRKGAFQWMKALKKEANKEILRKPKSGRVYIIRTKSGRRKRHVASAPGETHANLSGATRRSLSWKVFGSEKATFGYGVSTTGTNAAPAWAPYLENIDNEFNVEARPSLQNAIDAIDSRPFFDREIEKGFRERR